MLSKRKNSTIMMLKAAGEESKNSHKRVNNEILLLDEEVPDKFE
jgi:hypothetical protein